MYIVKNSRPTKTTTLQVRPDIQQHYTEAGQDYQAWSRNFNMHFGYFRFGMNPFNLEHMLEEMNRQVLKRLQISDTSFHVVDFGCGMGATIRHGKKTYKNCRFTGLTIMEQQVQKGNELIATAELSGANILHSDYCDVPLTDSSTDAAYAIESICHAKPAGRARAIAEMYRVLKTGGRIAIADCFEKNSHKPMLLPLQRIYKKVCNSWAVNSMADIKKFTNLLQETGFRNIRVEEISYNIAPSVAHAPFLVTKFALAKWLKREKLSQARKDHLIASLLALFLGMYRSRIGYFLICAEK